MAKLFAFSNKPNYTGTLFDFFQQIDQEGGANKVYVNAGVVFFDAVSDGYGQLTAIFDDKYNYIQVESQIQSIKTVVSTGTGVELIPRSVWTVTSFEPFINVFGRREGYKAKLDWERVT